MRTFAVVSVFCAVLFTILGGHALADSCPCQTMSGSACQIWKSTGAEFYWMTGSEPSSNITLTTGPCGQSGESATAYIYAYLNASNGLCDGDYETPCGGDDSWYSRYAKIKIVGDQEAFQHIFPGGLTFTGCFVYWDSNPNYSSLTITETNTECDLKLSSSQILRIALDAQATQCSSSYSGSKFTIQVRFYEARNSEETQFSLLDAATGSIVVRNNTKTSFDPLNFIPDVKEGTAVGWIEEKTYDLSNDTTDNRFKVTYKSTWEDYCTDVTEGIKLVYTSAPHTLIPSSYETVRVKLPGYKRDMHGLPSYAIQDGWSYNLNTNDPYIQYKGENGKIIFHCDSPADNGADNKRYLIRRVEYCSDSQEPDEGDDLWYLNYTYNSPAKIANIHNGSDPNDPNTVTSATIQYEYTWTDNSAEVDYKTRPTTSGEWQDERQWQVEFDDQDRAIKYDAGCSSGCSGSSEFENVTYFDSDEYDLTGYEYLIKERKNADNVTVLQNTYEVIDFGQWKKSDWLPLTNMDFEFPIIDGCVDQNDLDSISGWIIDSPLQTPHVQVCDTQSASGDQSVRPNNHIIDKDFQCYFSPRIQYKVSASIMADNDALHDSRGIIEFYYDDGMDYVLLGAIDVNDIASGELVEGQWEDFEVDIDCPEDITELTLSDVKLAVTGQYVYIDNMIFSRAVWVAGNSKPIIIEQKVLDENVTPAVLRTALTRSYDEESYVVTEKRYTSSTDYRQTDYQYTDRTFSRLQSKTEYDGFGDSFTTTYGGDDPNRIFITTYPNNMRADVQLYGVSGNVIESYILDTVTDVNSLRETYTYKDFYGSGGNPTEWRVETHTNAYGGTTQYEYETIVDSSKYIRLLKSQTDPNNAAGQQKIDYAYDDAWRVITETQKLDSERNLRTLYDYNPSTGFLDSTTVNGAATYYQHNAFGQVIRQTSPDGIMTGKSYGLGGELVSEFVISENSADPNGADTSLTLISQTRYTYTNDGKIEYVGKYKSDSEFSYQNPADITTAANWIVSKYEYFADGKKKKVIEDYGTGRTNLTTEYFYNLQGELEKVLYPTGKWVKTTRDGRGLVILEETGYGSNNVVLESAYSYDDNGNLEQQSNPDGRFLVYTYDNYDRLKRTYEGSTSGPYTEKFYDNAGNVIRQIACEADGTVLSDSRSEYDTLGNVVFERLCFEPNSIDNDKDFTSHYEYDIAGNLRFDIKAKLASSEPNAITTEFIYNRQGRRTQTIDPAGWHYSVYYTDGGLVTMTVDPNDPADPNAFITENIYDSYGRLLKTIDPIGHYTENTYNSLNQITERTLYDCKDPNNPNDDVAIRQVRTEFDDLGNITRQAVMADPSETGSIVLGTDLVTDYVFEPNGLLSEQKTYVGSSSTEAKTTFSYDSIGRKQKTTDPENNWEKVYYNTADETKGSQVVKVEQFENDPDGSNDYTITTFFEYDTDGRLEKKILDEDGDGVQESTDQETVYDYDGLGRIEIETANDGVETHYSYDGFGNVKQTIEDYVDGTPDIDHDRMTEFVYNRLNQQVQTKAYDPNDTTSQISIQTTTYEFDDNGNVSKIIYPDNEYATYEYGLGNKLMTEIKRDGTWIGYWYDYNKNLTQISDYDEYDPNCPNVSASFIEQYEYNGAGDLTNAYKEIDGSEVSDSSFTYNGFGAKTSETAQYDSGISKTTSWTYDGAGNQLTQTHGNTVLTFTHDRLGRIKTIDKGDDGIVTYDYIGRNTEAIDYPEADTTQLFAYDDLGRIVECESVDVNEVAILDFEYTYDSVGNQDTCKYNHLTTPVYDVYEYDSLRRLEKVTYADADGIVALAIDDEMSMDNLVLVAAAWVENRPVTYHASNDTLLAKRLSQMESILKEAGFRNIESFLNSVKSIEAIAFNPDDPIYTLAVFPDEVPNNYTTETVKNDEGDIIAQIIWDNKEHMVLFAMYPDNGDTVVVQTTYDNKDNKTSEILTVFNADGNATYTEDMLYTAQQAALETESLSAASMSLDSSLIAMSSTPESMQARIDEFGYDHLGNRNTVYLDKGTMAQEMLTYSHNLVNQYSTITSSFLGGSISSAYSMSHDDNGNLSTDENGWSYSYDYRNRLIEVEDSNSLTVAEYMFDALGRRISKTVGSETTYFFYDTAGRVIAEYDDSTTPVLEREYVYGNRIDEVLAMFTPYHAGDPDDWDDFVDFCGAWLSDPNDTGTWIEGFDHNNDDIINFEDFAYFAGIWDIPSFEESDWYYLRDALGSTRGLVGGRFKRESDREFWNYDVYGKLSIQDGKESKSGNTILFAGYRYDPETGLYLTEFRMYDPEIGRWMQFDPIGNADSMSLYEYVMSNPTNYIDPLGLVYEMLHPGGRPLPPGKNNGKGFWEYIAGKEYWFGPKTDKYLDDTSKRLRTMPSAAKDAFTEDCLLIIDICCNPGKICDKASEVKNAVNEKFQEIKESPEPFDAALDAGKQCCVQIVVSLKDSGIETFDKLTSDDPTVSGEALGNLWYQASKTAAVAKGCEKGFKAAKEMANKMKGAGVADDIVYNCTKNPANKIRFGQKGVSSTFRYGEFAGRSIDDVASGLRSGAIHPDQLPVQVINRNGVTYTVNNRSLMALRKAGMEPTIVKDITGNTFFEKELTKRLAEIGCEASSDFVPVIRGGKK